jgi:predicted RND superfamily exporter protein
MTTMAGFSSLMLAGHQGIASLGLVMTLGVLFTLISALLILPPLITVLAEFLPASQHFRAKKNQ